MAVSPVGGGPGCPSSALSLPGADSGVAQRMTGRGVVPGSCSRGLVASHGSRRSSLRVATGNAVVSLANALACLWILRNVVAAASLGSHRWDPR